MRNAILQAASKKLHFEFNIELTFSSFIVTFLFRMCCGLWLHKWSLHWGLQMCWLVFNCRWLIFQPVLNKFLPSHNQQFTTFIWKSGLSVENLVLLMMSIFPEITFSKASCEWKIRKGHLGPGKKWVWTWLNQKWSNYW